MSERAQKPAPLAELGLGAAWLVGIAAALQIVERLPIASIAVAVVGAFVVDLGAGRAGVRWDEAPESPDRPKIAARLVGKGALAALAVGAVVMAASFALGWAHGTGYGIHPSAAIAIAMLRAGAIAVRDEILYRGIPLLAASRAGLPAPAARVFSALAGGAAMSMMPGASAASIALATGAGLFYASLWQRDRGAWSALGAHGAWLLSFGSLLHGGLFEIDWHVGEIAIGNTSKGAPAWLAAASFVVASLVVGRKKRA